MATWNPVNESKLARLWGEGKTASEIADALGDGITRNMVIGKSRRMNLERRPSPIRRTEAA